MAATKIMILAANWDLHANMLNRYEHTHNNDNSNDFSSALQTGASGALIWPGIVRQGFFVRGWVHDASLLVLGA